MPRSRTRKSAPYKPTRGRFAGRSFPSEREYRATLARSNRARAQKAKRRPSRPPKASRKAVLAQQRRADALEVLNNMRRGKLDLKAAIKSFNAANPDSRTTARVVTKYIRPALRRKKGEWIAKPHDRLLRVMRFSTPTGGVIDLKVRSSRTASRIGEYWNAVKQYQNTGDDSGLRRFQGKSIRVGGRKYPFVTDTTALDQQAEGGEFEFDSIYEKLASG